ncbi:unnamed protein product [Callosobruchus maculatus]|uniref:Uncharacterized protein n=1 Tax=Callosobruchus maculatus TaxID=64391 RepID=A0A653BS93_CALMS|nr:unnamed protein product [Callosobruchus maculatus]
MWGENHEKGQHEKACHQKTQSGTELGEICHQALLIHRKMNDLLRSGLSYFILKMFTNFLEKQKKISTYRETTS